MNIARGGASISEVGEGRFKGLIGGPNICRLLSAEEGRGKHNKGDWRGGLGGAEKTSELGGRDRERILQKADRYEGIVRKRDQQKGGEYSRAKERVGGD